MRPIEWEFHRTPRQLHASHRPCRRDRVPRARMHYEERHLVPPGECLELPGGLGHAVHFMVDARKKRRPWTILFHVSASDDTTSLETASGGIMSLPISCGTSGAVPRRNTRSIARCTVAFSSRRTPDNICSTYAGGPFQSVEIARSGPPFASGWKMRS